MLSGGQRTSVAIALALAKRPWLLVLDEPFADLDPLARHDLARILMADAAERNTTILLSSHVLADLEGICDYLLLLGQGRVRVAGGVDEILAAHRLLTTTSVAGQADPAIAPPHVAVETRVTGRQTTVLARLQGPVRDVGCFVERPTLDELVLAYLRSPTAPSMVTPDARVDDPLTSTEKVSA